jgi:flagellin-like protein
MKKLFRNRKAVSPVIATVLMIMVTMAGMTILFGFVISYSDAYKAGIGSSVMESLTVEDVWFSPESYPARAVQISIYNVGKVDSTITSIYANGLKLTDTLGGQNFNLEEDISIDSHSRIILYWNENWNIGSYYTFTIATKMGSTFEVTYKVP